MLVKGRTAIDGSAEPRRRGFWCAAGPGGRGGIGLLRTAPTKRTPLRGRVRIRRCSSPLSPMAARAELTRLLRVASETMRPRQTAAIRSSRLTTRSREPIGIQEVEDLRLDRDEPIAAAQLAPAGVEDEVIEMITQNCSLRGGAKGVSEPSTTRLPQKSKLPEG